MADALAALELPQVATAKRIADIGAGAGFPGLALAVAIPDAQVDLLESVGRKVAVIARLAEAAELRNVQAIHVRAEDHAAAARSRYDLVTARAVGSLPLVLEYAAPLLAQDGSVVVWRGRRDPEEEAAGAEAAGQLGLGDASITAVAPFPEARDRHLQSHHRVAPVPERFPRRAGMARKRPLA